MLSGYRFGRIAAKGRTYTDDIKVIDDRVIPDWWRQRGHQVDIDDVADLLAADPETVVFGTGSAGRMTLTDALKQTLEDRGIEWVAAPTAEAVQTFNRLLTSRQSVAGGFHLTC
jgi:hypothetical protein